MSPLDKDIANLWIPIPTRPTECTVLPYFWLSLTFWSNIYFYYLFIYSLISSKVTMGNGIDLKEITKFLNQYPSRYTVLHGLYTVPDRKWRILNYRALRGSNRQGSDDTIPNFDLLKTPIAVQLRIRKKVRPVQTVPCLKGVCHETFDLYFFSWFDRSPSVPISPRWSNF